MALLAVFCFPTTATIWSAVSCRHCGFPSTAGCIPSSTISEKRRLLKLTVVRYSVTVEREVTNTCTSRIQRYGAAHGIIIWVPWTWLLAPSLRQHCPWHLWPLLRHSTLSAACLMNVSFFWHLRYSGVSIVTLRHS